MMESVRALQLRGYFLVFFNRLMSTLHLRGWVLLNSIRVRQAQKVPTTTPNTRALDENQTLMFRCGRCEEVSLGYKPIGTLQLGVENL